MRDPRGSGKNRETGKLVMNETPEERHQRVLARRRETILQLRIQALAKAGLPIAAAYTGLI